MDLDKRVFHSGELAMQKKAGVGERTLKFAKRAILDHMSSQLQDFFPQLNTLFVASIDAENKPWASILVGQQGFIETVDATHLLISSDSIIGSDRLNKNLILGDSLGFLGLEFHTRRRNRLTGNLTSIREGKMMIEVTKAFGNCPKYIQTRRLTIPPMPSSVKRIKNVRVVKRIDKEIEKLINISDTFFIASCAAENGVLSVDISHRGGKPGFVKIESDNVISFEDYPGNNFYMTLGNLHLNPNCGLLFVNFDSGDVLQLSCKSEIVETLNSEDRRKVEIFVESGLFHKSALNVTWKFCEYSPYLESYSVQSCKD